MTIISNMLQLRLLYECIPMAYIIEQAGGLATTGSSPILDVIPNSIHQRSPIFLGSKEDVEDVIECFKKYVHVIWWRFCFSQGICCSEDFVNIRTLLSLILEVKPWFALGRGFMEVAEQEILSWIYQLDISFRNIGDAVVSRKSIFHGLAVCYVEAATFGMLV